MILAHNLTAMNAQRQFNIVGTAKKKSTEKLSSGYKINRAADDAAGLSISEKMRKQVRGLTRASDNCQDGVSLCQVADGALAETHEILQRINELSIQSANGTNSSSDRAAIQAEVKQLTDEIDRIATTTSFNERIFPLKFDITEYMDKEKIIPVESRIKIDENGKKWVLPDYIEDYEICFKVKDDAITFDGINYSPGNTFTASVVAKKGEDSTISECYWDVGGIWYGNIDNISEHPIIGSVADENSLSVCDLNVNTEGDIYFVSKHNGEKYYIFNTGVIIGGDKAPTYILGKTWKCLPYGEIKSNLNMNIMNSISIHAGSESDMTLKIPVNIVNATKKGLGLTEPELDLSTEDGATAAINRVKNAIEIVSGYRSYFGATQNRLEHTVANLDNVVENTQAAESRIRDTDMAKEMVNNTKLNILEQAVTSMMSQANQSNQGVLSLLQ